MDIRFAFAVNGKNEFENKHFGEADKFLIYKIEEDSMKKESEEENKFKVIGHGKKHGIKKKGEAIIEFLKSKNVNILVARQFGKNISMINAHFIPVVISGEKPEGVIEILIKYFSWIYEEWIRNTSEYKLFTIKGGILKSAIEDK